MKFGIHNSSWLERPDPGGTFEAVKAKAQWAEDHGFVWFSVLDHMMQIPPRGRARRAVPGRLDRPGGAGCCHEPVLRGHCDEAGRALLAKRPGFADQPRTPAHKQRIANAAGFCLFTELTYHEVTVF